MRTLVVSSVYPSQTQPNSGVFVHERVRYVAEHCDVRVVAPVPWFLLNRWIRGWPVAATPAVEERDGITVYHPRFFSLPRFGKSLDGVTYFLSLLPFMARLRRAYPFDVIDAHFAYPDGAAAVLVGKVLRCPAVITVRGDEARLAAHPLRRVQMRFALRHARVISVSDSLRQVAARLGVEPERVRVIPNGVDSSRFHPLDQRTARGQLGLPHDRPILLSVGALIERKGHHRIAEILPALLAEHPNLLYLVVGDEAPGNKTGHRAVLGKLVRRGGLENHVRIVPSQPHSEIPTWMAAADVFCLATRWEGWCNALMEALACGVPVVTTRVGGNEEFVQHGWNGLLVHYWDARAFAAAVLKALEVPWDRASIAAEAATHGWGRVASQILEELAAARNGTRRERFGASATASAEQRDHTV